MYTDTYASMILLSYSMHYIYVQFDTPEKICSGTKYM